MNNVVRHKDELVIGVDLGTINTKTSIFDLRDRVLAEAYVEAQLHYPRPGQVEQRQEDFYPAALPTVTQCVRPTHIDPQCSAPHGRINFLTGLPKDRATIPLTSNLVQYKEFIGTATQAGSTADYRRALALLNAGDIRFDALVSARYPLPGLRRQTASPSPQSRSGDKLIVLKDPKQHRRSSDA